MNILYFTPHCKTPTYSGSQGFKSSDYNVGFLKQHAQQTNPRSVKKLNVNTENTTSSMSTEPLTHVSRDKVKKTRFFCSEERRTLRGRFVNAHLYLTRTSIKFSQGYLPYVAVYYEPGVNADKCRWK
jgi:hypothetical protein